MSLPNTSVCSPGDTWAYTQSNYVYDIFFYNQDSEQPEVVFEPVASIIHGRKKICDDTKRWEGAADMPTA